MEAQDPAMRNPISPIAASAMAPISPRSTEYSAVPTAASETNKRAVIAFLNNRSVISSSKEQVDRRAADRKWRIEPHLILGAVIAPVNRANFAHHESQVRSEPRP